MTALVLGYFITLAVAAVVAGAVLGLGAWISWLLRKRK